MKKLAFGALLGGVFAFAAACGGGGGAKIDAHNINVGDGGADGTTLACNPISQSGCGTGMKCTWIVDQAGTATTDDLAHIGCAPDGTVALGGTCTGGPGVVGADNCIHGTGCEDAKCQQLCDPTSQTSCPAADSCTQFSNYYTSGSDTVAGVCEPSCDILAQKQGFSISIGQATASGSACPLTSSGKPGGCYGEPFKNGSFECVGAGSAAYTDGMDMNAAVGSNNIHLNTCAPGNEPIFQFTINGATKVFCQGFCQPGDTYGGTSWTGTTLAAGTGSIANANGTSGFNCAHWSGNSAESCLYVWSLDGGDNGDFDPSAGGDPLTALEPWSDHLGLCWDLSAYDTFPADGANGTAEPVPQCKAMATNPDPTVNCSATMLCNTTNLEARAFGAVDNGCTSFEFAMAHQDPAMATGVKRPSAISDIRMPYTHMQRAR